MKYVANNPTSKGQALITLLVFIVIGVTVTSAAIIIMVLSTQSTSRYQQGLLTYYVAEGGMENALLRLLRNPSYTGEANLLVGNGSADITVSGSNPKTVTSVGSLGNFSKTIQATVNDSGGYFTVTSWKEVY